MCVKLVIGEQSAGELDWVCVKLVEGEGLAGELDWAVCGVG